MKLITNDETLRRYMPNAFATAKGETPLFDKIAPWLMASEQWLVENICGADTLAEIVALDDMNVVKMLASQIVVSDAMRCAIPSLDLVLTPNGFGIVSNTNVAPASKERIERLIASLETNRDNAIEQLIPLLVRQIEVWKQSAQYAWFITTLFPNLDITTLCGIKEHRWDKYCELRQKIIGIEQSLAEEYISHELMSKYREMAICFEPVPLLHTLVFKGIRWQIVELLKGETICHRTMADIISYVRTRPETFPEWHNSDTAKLFSPPIFKNLKTNKGYWF